MARRIRRFTFLCSRCHHDKETYLYGREIMMKSADTVVNCYTIRHPGSRILIKFSWIRPISLTHLARSRSTFWYKHAWVVQLDATSRLTFKLRTGLSAGKAVVWDLNVDRKAMNSDLCKTWRPLVAGRDLLKTANSDLDLVLSTLVRRVHAIE